MSDTGFTQSFDALVWAKAFVEHVQRNPEIPTDEATMLGWFANALMRGYDEHARRHEAAPPSVSPTAEELKGFWNAVLKGTEAIRAIAGSLSAAEPEWMQLCDVADQLEANLRSLRVKLAGVPSTTAVPETDDGAR